ncbi:nitrite reductase/ring-hydroxylating ferredoxin subunit [Silvimonas terrae]|uniref:Nitrite reductase/ring-hydroxylating ferredoxin subunit n=1 Tax=Silvimonas terrae TaxID=300266 RepID=A0A840RA53_9NEIS|nr:Rieske 2Fe-2S domain-containing protein [Silvimonas terrae]MBB5189303.1 nitrite reductase/ring-hydroxylating ferredoxin subunit [Silvimonas terrae]
MDTQQSVSTDADGQEICDSGALTERGLGQRFRVDWYGEEREAFAVRFGGKVYAYLNSCAHIPIELDYQPGDFFDLSHNFLVCATHGAYYAPESGLCLGGPCPGRRLESVPVAERAGKIYWLSPATGQDGWPD